MKSDRGKQSHVFVWLGVKAGRSARDLRLVLLFVLMTTVCLSATGQVGPDAPKRRPPIGTAPNKPPPVRAPSRGLDVKGEVLKTLRNSFVRIPPGAFMMGSMNGYTNTQPVHSVRISRGFEIGKYEVTQAQWEAVMRSNPSKFKGANLPVENTSWEETKRFITQLNALNDGYAYGLPTEAEWEYSCRAGSTGDYAGEPKDMGWYLTNSGDKTHPVGEMRPNSWGLYDMHGNVSEWCQDWYDETYYRRSPVVDPKGPTSGSNRVFRGGNWGVNPINCQSWFRNSSPPDVRNPTLGFRLVRTQR